MWCKVWFWNVSSLHSLLNSFSFLSCWCQIDASNAISDLTTAEYTCLIFVKITLHMKILKRLSISIFMTWLTSICQRCASHCSFMFSWIFRTCTSDFNLMTELFICMLIIMLNLLINNEIYLYEMLTTNLLQAMLVKRAEQSHQHWQSSNSALLTCWAHTQSKSEAITTRSLMHWSLHIHRITATSLHTYCSSYTTYTHILWRHDSAFAHI